MWQRQGSEAENTGAGENTRHNFKQMFYCSDKNSWSCRLLPLPEAGTRLLSGDSTFQVGAPALSHNCSEHNKYSQGYPRTPLATFTMIYIHTCSAT